MIKNIMFLFMAIVLLAGFGFAQETINGHEITQDDIDGFISIYNQNTDQVPDFVKGIISNERINIEITTNSGILKEFNAVMEGTSIQAASIGTLTDATLVIKTNQATIERIAASVDPVGELRIALNTGDISYHGLGFVSSIKYGIVKLLSGLFGF